MRKKITVRRLMLLLLLVAALPGVAVVVFGYFSAREEAVQHAREEIRSVARLALANQEQVIKGVHQFLATVASSPSVRRDDLRSLCFGFLSNVAQTTPGYGMIGVANLDGDMQCQSGGSVELSSVAGRSDFRRAVQSRQFSVGAYIVDGGTGEKQLGFAMPVFDSADALVGVAFTTLELIPASAQLESLLSGGQIRVNITDAEGTVLTASHGGAALVGTRLLDAALLDVIHSRVPQSLSTEDLAGVEWLHEITQLGQLSGEPLFAVASAPQGAVLNASFVRLKQQLAILALATVLGILLALRLAEKQIAQPIDRLLQRMRAVAENLPDVESERNAPSEEFSALGIELTTMLQRLGETREHLLKAQQITRIGFYELDMEARVFRASEAIYELLGLDHAMGPVPLDQYLTMIHPEDQELLRKNRNLLIENGTTQRLQYRIVRPDGKTRWVDGFGFVERDEEGRLTRYAGALQDITEQQRLRRLYVVQSKINEAILTARSVQDLFDRVCHISVDHGEMRMACIATAEDDGRLLMAVASAGHDEGYTDLINEAALEIAHYKSPVPTALRTGELTVSNDMLTDPNMGTWVDEASSRGYRAVAVVPFSVVGEKPRALVLMAAEPAYFQEAECRQLVAIGESLASAVNHLNEEVRRLARETRLKLLETCVAQLNDIVLITEAEPICSPGPRIVFVNDAFERLTGFTRSEAIGQTPRILQGPNTQSDVLDRVRRNLTQWLPVQEEIINYTKDGQEFWLEMTIVPVADASGWVTHWVSVERDITQRKQAELKEARLREGFKLLFLGNPHPMWVFDVKTRAFLEVNHAAEDQYGYSQDEFKQLTIDDIRPESEKVRLKNRVNARSASGRDKAGTWIHQRKDGSLLSVGITAQRLTHNGHEAELVVAIDLTDRINLEKQKEEALAEIQASQTRLVRAQALARMGSWVRYANGDPAIWSESLYELTGNDPAKGPPSFQECLSRVHPEDHADYSRTMQEGWNLGKTRQWTYRCLMPDGRFRWLEENMDEPTRGPDGEIVSISGTVQDVTERIEGAQKLHMQLSRTELLNNIVRASDERLNLERIFEVVCERVERDFDVDLAAVLVYDVLTLSFGLAWTGARGRLLQASMGLSEEGATLPAGHNGLARCVGGELVYEPDTSLLPFDFPQRLASAGLGSVVLAPMRTHEHVFGVLVAARKTIKGFVSGECEFMRQLAEHVALAASHARLYQDLQKAYEELRDAQQSVLQQERLRVLGQMASGIAHDINNAISPMALYTESLLENEEGLSERGRKQLTTVQLAIDDVAETVARMREFYRPAEGFSLRVSVDLNHLLNQVLELTRARWQDIPQQSGISIELVTDLAPTLPSIWVAEGEIRDLVTNLVLNAVDAMPDGGTLTLSTSMISNANDELLVMLEVSDTGMGMDEQVLKRCMEPFFTTKGQKGSGLGLSMVFGTVQRHEADITINSEPGEGTTVGLYFKVHHDVKVQEATPPEQPALQTLPRLRILLVDDDVLVLQSMKETLEKEGHLVVMAQGGQEGVALFSADLQSARFDLVITDLGMPGVDGRAVAAQVKAISPTTPVIMLTGWGRRMLEEGERPPGVDCLLSKPPRIASLRSAMASCVAASDHGN